MRGGATRGTAAAVAVVVAAAAAVAKSGEVNGAATITGGRLGVGLKDPMGGYAGTLAGGARCAEAGEAVGATNA